MLQAKIGKVTGRAHERARTFGERGAAVPFRTPSLFQARMRRGLRGGYECLLSGYSGGRGTYVLDWKYLPEGNPMVPLDRMLHKHIMDRTEEDVATPRGIRRAVLDLSLMGIFGAEAAAEADRQVARTKRQALLGHYYLVRSVLQATGADLRVLSATGGSTSQAEAQKSIRLAFDRLARELRVPPLEIWSLLETLPAAIVPVLPTSTPDPGHLRTTISRLEVFADGHRFHSETKAPEFADMSSFCVAAAEITLLMARGALARIDRLLNDVASLLGSADIRGALDAEIRRLEWILDGWEPLMALWDSVSGKGAPEQIQGLRKIVQGLPLMPGDELPTGWQSVMEDLAAAHRKRRWEKPDDAVEAIARVA